ncbi:hypothetical protein C3941_04490 [Kaistia algarum]|uniref:hypothetical protein n=1 Tax=Kaistia algarum TaxID=2083279 RepID=UPI000CE8A109|nr:hypothetical protein [Kaistia algarum]MCX5512525.1 hypothetical protein [Kaistia algarum]PPE81946.1 hypothetical protein C3941_04490 [Kaistia algarum]
MRPNWRNSWHKPLVETAAETMAQGVYEAMIDKYSSDRENLTKLLRSHCVEFGVRYIAPYSINNNLHGLVEFCAYIPDFGSKNGAFVDFFPEMNVMDLTYRRSIANKMRAFISFINPESLGSGADFVDCLVDWGYYGSDEQYSSKMFELGIPRYR